MKNIMICLEKMCIGGIETSVLNQAIEYKKRGINPIIVAANGIYSDFLKENDITFEEVDFPLENNVDSNKTKRIMEIIEKYEVEQVIINQLPCILSVMPACIIKNVPYVAYVHTSFSTIKNDDNNMYNWYERTYPIYKDLLKIYFQNACRIVAISKLAAEYVINRYEATKDKVIILHNSINLDVYKSENKENKKEKFVLISRLSQEKLESVKNGIEIFEKYDCKNKKMTIVGDGDKREELEQYVNLKKDKDKIHFAGACTNVKEIIDQNDIVLGVDRVILEAITMKKIAVIIGYSKPKQIITKENIEKEAEEGFSGENLQSTSIEELANQIKENDIDVEENYNYVKENLNIQKNIYIEEKREINYEKANIEIIKLIEKLQDKNLELQEKIPKINEKYEEKLNIELEKANKELAEVKKQSEEILKELQSVYNSKRFKIVNKIANIISFNK